MKRRILSLSHSAGRWRPQLRNTSPAKSLDEVASLDDLGTVLINQIVMLQLLGRLLSIDYRACYESDEQAEGFLKLTLYTEGLYQQIHAAVTTAAVLVGSHAAPVVVVKGLSDLDQRVVVEGHELAAQLRRNRREVSLLRWLLRVRNKAIQHRAEAGYVGSRGIVLPEGFALLHASRPIAPEVRQKANDLFVGLHRRYGNPEQQRVESREVVTYLDLMSHSLFAEAPSDFDAARRIVEEARALDVVVSPAMLENADVALAVLIGLWRSAE